MLDYNGSQIQILDLPGIIEGASSGKGLGKRVLSVARNANLVLMVLDVFQIHHLEVLKKELFEIGVKVNEKPPDVVVEKTSTGGISVNIQAPVEVDENFIKNVMRINGYHNGRITIREKGLTIDQLNRCLIWKSYLYTIIGSSKQNRFSGSSLSRRALLRN